MPTDKDQTDIKKAILESLPIADQPEESRRTKMRKAIERAITHTFDEFTKTYPELGKFMSQGVRKNLVAFELLKIISQEDEPDPHLIARIWAEGILPTTLEKAAISLIEQLRQEFSTDPLLEPLITHKSELERYIKERQSVKRGQDFLSAGYYQLAFTEFSRILENDPTNILAARKRQEVIDLIRNEAREDSGDIIKFFLSSSNSADDELTPEYLEELTPEYLSVNLSPYLTAIAEFQAIIDNILGRNFTKVLIKSITQNSPIGISLDGVSETIQLIVDYVIPSKRKHAEKMAEYSRREKQYEIEKKRVEIQEINFNSLKNKQELEKTSIEIEKMRVEAEKLRIDNEKARLELVSIKIDVASNILAKVAPNLSETERLTRLVSLLPIIETIVSSDLEIMTKLRES